MLTEVKRTILRKLIHRATATSLPGRATPGWRFQWGFLKRGGACRTGLFLLPVSLSLEVSVGKATTIYAVNGTEILLPCTFSSCFGFQDLHFWWSYNISDTYRIVSSRGRDRTSQTLLPSLSPHPCLPFPCSGPFRTDLTVMVPRIHLSSSFLLAFFPEPVLKDLSGKDA